jgi:diguanylate cyclase (GGDEF)-like protein
VSAAQQPIPPIATHRAAQLREAVSKVDVLPCTISVPMRLLELKRNPNSTMAQYASALTFDPSLVAKVLGLVNSAAFKPVKPITRVSQALVMIGLKNLLPLAFGAALGGIYNQFALPADERGVLWKGALLKAVAAREYALAVAPEHAEEAMIAGLTQDVALPLLYAVDRSAWPEAQAVFETPDRDVREQRLYGTDHAQLAAALAKRLGLPELFQAAAARQHDSAEALTATVKHEGLARAIAFAAAFPHRVGPGNPFLKHGITRPLKMIEQWGGVQPAHVWASVSNAYMAILNRLGDADEKSGAFKPFMTQLCAEVAACLESAIGHSTQVISDLTDRGTALEQEAAKLRQQVAMSDFDLLTKVLNRRGFMRRAQTLAAKAAEGGVPTVIGFVDLDLFKGINDTYGHDTGDRALVTVAQRLSEMIHKQGVVGRLGGDEFAFVAFAADQGARVALVERVREHMCQFEMDAEEGPLKLSCSIGIADCDAVTTLPQLEATLRRADELMYGAKRAGKGRVAAAPPAPQTPPASAA